MSTWVFLLLFFFSKLISCCFLPAWLHMHIRYEGSWKTLFSLLIIMPSICTCRIYVCCTHRTLAQTNKAYRFHADNESCLYECAIFVCILYLQFGRTTGSTDKSNPRGPWWAWATMGAMPLELKSAPWSLLLINQVLCVQSYTSIDSSETKRQDGWAAGDRRQLEEQSRILDHMKQRASVCQMTRQSVVLN
jgi:hypothetical protein